MTILRAKDVVQLTGLSRVSIWRYERAGQFPPRIQLGPNSVGWIEEEVLDWIETRPRGLVGHTRQQLAEGLE